MTKAEENAAALKSLPPKVRKEFITAIKTAAQAKSLEVEYKRLKEESSSILLPIMAAYEIKTYTMEGVGRVGKRTNKGSNINAKSIRQGMMLEGLDLEVIDRIVDGATKSWETDYVEFKTVV